MTINEKHLEKPEHKTSDNHLPGAQITKPEDSAVKTRQEMLDGLKSYRVTKDGNPFTIDMGNGAKVQDVRQTEKITAAVEQAIVHRDVSAAQMLPGDGDFNPNHKLDLSQVTLKTETSINKDGHIVTTENRADGSTRASTQEIGADGKLHIVSTEVRDAIGTVTTEKFDPTSGQKTEEIKDSLFATTDTKFNTNGQPDSKETTNKFTGQTDQEQWFYAASNGKCIWHAKNGVPVESEGIPDFLDKLHGKEPLKNEVIQDGVKGWLDFKIPMPKDHHWFDDKYDLKEYNDTRQTPSVHLKYDSQHGTWNDASGKPHQPPPDSAYDEGRPTSAAEQIDWATKRNFQKLVSQLAWLAHFAGSA